jgi:hypothetical protein
MNPGKLHQPVRPESTIVSSNPLGHAAEQEILKPPMVSNMMIYLLRTNTFTIDPIGAFTHSFIIFCLGHFQYLKSF